MLLLTIIYSLLAVVSWFIFYDIDDFEYDNLEDVGIKFTLHYIFFLPALVGMVLLFLKHSENEI